MLENYTVNVCPTCKNEGGSMICNILMYVEDGVGKCDRHGMFNRSEFAHSVIQLDSDLFVPYVHS